MNFFDAIKNGTIGLGEWIYYSARELVSDRLNGNVVVGYELPDGTKVYNNGTKVSPTGETSEIPTQRQFAALSTDASDISNTSGNVTIHISKNLLSSNYCQFGDIFGCAEVQTTLAKNASTLQFLKLTMGVDLQSVKQIVYNSKTGTTSTRNAADSATLVYTWECLQDANSYLDFFRKTISQFLDVNVNLAMLSFTFITPQFNNMILQVMTSAMPQSATNVLQIGVTSIAKQCAIEGSKEAAKLYGLIALVALAAIPIYFIYTRRMEIKNRLSTCCAGIFGGSRETEPNYVGDREMHDSNTNRPSSNPA